MYTAITQLCTYMHTHAYMSDLRLQKIKKQNLCYNSNLNKNATKLYFIEEYLI